MSTTFPLPPVPNVNWQNAPTDVLQARVATDAPRVPWDKFLRLFDWRQGEHVALIGPTGQGKTTFMMALLPKHPYVVVFATKPRDDTMDELERRGYRRMEVWPRFSMAVQKIDDPKRLLWPNARTIDATEVQKKVFKDAFARIYVEGGWTVAIDELWYIVTELRLEHEIRLFLQQGRSLGLSLIVATQRPKRVPLEIYDQSTHLIFWRDNDAVNLARIGDVNNRSTGLIKHIVSNLERHQVLYVNTRTGQMFRTRAPAPKG